MATAVAMAALVVALGALPGQAAAKTKSTADSSAVTTWIDMTLQEIKGHSTNPVRASRLLAYVSVAMRRASASGTGAVHTAAATALASFFADRADFLKAHGAELAAGKPGADDGPKIAASVLERTKSDNSTAKYDEEPPTGDGYWEPTPPAFAAPLEGGAGQWKPWNVKNVGALVPGKPPRPGSKQFEKEMREVYDVGTHLTAEQKKIALFWADGPGTFTPPGHWNQIASDIVKKSNLTERQAARAFALLNTAQADAFITCWLTKYTYWLLRPVTAIQREIDANWQSLIATPPFPSYISGHSTDSGAAGTVLAAIFPSRASKLQAMAREAMNSRLYGGIHYRVDNVVGLKTGQKVGRAALKSYCGKTASRRSCLGQK